MTLTNGLVVITPTSVSKVNGSISIRSDGSVAFTNIDVAYINGVFTSEYDNYMVVINHSETSAGGANYIMRLTSGGTANTGSYTRQILYINGSTATASRANTNYFVTGSTAAYRSGQTVYFFGPYLTQRTVMRSLTGTGYPSSTPAVLADFASLLDADYSADGFSLIPGSSQLSSGSLTVFGFNQ